MRVRVRVRVRKKVGVRVRVRVGHLVLEQRHQLALLLQELRHVVVEGVVLHHVHAGEARDARHLRHVDVVAAAHMHGGGAVLAGGEATWIGLGVGQGLGLG